MDKQDLFLENGDRVRFVHNLFEFNDAAPANNTSRRLMNDLRSHLLGERKMLIDIHGWCLMRNHYHILISERRVGGLTQFIRKLNIGYSKFFNDKYKRSGTLFQGRTKKILISSQSHFLHILNYIHLNPLDYRLESAQWRERHIKDSARALAYLKKYRWSSYLDYCGIQNFPSIINTRLFRDVFGNYEKELVSYLKDLEVDSIQNLTL